MSKVISMSKLGKNPFQLLTTSESSSDEDDEDDEDDDASDHSSSDEKKMIEKNEKKTKKEQPQIHSEFDVCIYHSPCQDGTASAWIVSKLFAGITLIECIAGTDPDDEEGNIHITDFADKSVLFADIAPSAEYLVNLLTIARNITIIDHHATTLEMVHTLSTLFDDGVIPPNFHLIHDETKSAAELVWLHFHPTQKIPWFIQVIADRDLFRQSYPNTRELSAALYTKKYTFDFTGLDKLYAVVAEKLEGFKQKLVWDGTMIVRKRDELIRDYLYHRVECEYKSAVDNHTYRVWMYDCPRQIISDLGHTLANTRFSDGGYPDFVVTWIYDFEDHKFWLAFRSTPGKTEVHRIARELSPTGGGHRFASGCALPGGTELRTIFHVMR